MHFIKHTATTQQNGKASHPSYYNKKVGLSNKRKEHESPLQIIGPEHGKLTNIETIYNSGSARLTESMEDLCKT